MSFQADPFIIIKSYRGNSGRKASMASNGEKNKNSWTSEENGIYIRFFQENPDFVLNKETRKRNKIFVQMGKLIPSRDPKQIKSHHQKLLIKHGTI
jgi:hypothetical protein